MSESQSVFMSSGYFPTQELAEVFRMGQEWGITDVELTGGLTYRADYEEVILAQSSGFALQVHNYFPIPEEAFVLNLSNGIEAERERSIEHCVKALELSAAVGSEFYAAHCGFVGDIKPHELGREFKAEMDMSRSQATEVFLDSIRQVLARLPEGVVFAVENNVLNAGNARSGKADRLLGLRSAELISYFQEIDDPRFGILLDVAHLKVSAHNLGFDKFSAVRELVPFVKGLHLSDNDGLNDQNRGFGEDAWFVPMLKDFKGLPVTIEVYGEQGPDAALRMIDLVSREMS